MLKIRSNGKWYEYPEDQIESWDEDGNIKWSNKIHWKFLRVRPLKGEEFIIIDKPVNVNVNKEKVYKKNMNFEIIKKIIEIFEKNNIKIISDYGTLLGCIRNSGFIKTDKDLDFSIILENNYKENLKNLLNDLLKNNLIITLHQKGSKLRNINIETLLKNGRFVIKGKEIKPIDIFFWVRDRENNWKRIKYLLEDDKYKKGKDLKDDWISEIIYKKFEEIEIPCPIKYEELLEHRYGDWKTEINYYK